MKPTPLKAGTAWADVTPPAFTHMTGMGINRPKPTGVHDRLKARALVLAAGGEKVALVTVDMNYIDFDSVSAIRRLVEQYTDIRGDRVRVISSHSHSSPGRYQFSKVGSSWGMDERARFVWEEESKHVEAAGRIIAGAVYEANLHLVDAEIGFGAGTSKFNIIRWHLTADGRMRYVPYHRELEPNLEPLTDMFIMHVRERRSGRSLAFFYTNSAHCICVCTQSDLITADYPAFVADAVERKFGGLSMFAPGTIGDQHPRDFDRGFKAAQKMGRQLAGEIVKAQKKMSYASDLAIRSLEREFELTVRPENAGKADFTRTRMSVVALNDVALCFWPGEAFSTITRRLAAESPFARTVLVSNADDFKYYFALACDFRKYAWDPDGAQPSLYALEDGDRLLALNLDMLMQLST